LRIAVLCPTDSTTAFADLLYFNPASPDPTDDPAESGRALLVLADSGGYKSVDIPWHLSAVSMADAVNAAKASVATTVVVTPDALGERKRREDGFTRAFLGMYCRGGSASQIFEAAASMKEHSVGFPRLR
jgi:hypothetical protein